MSALEQPPKALIFASVLLNQDEVTDIAIKELWEKMYGPSIYFYPQFNPLKKYYSKEMGEEERLQRFFIVKEEMVARDALIKGKLWAISIESMFSKNGKRFVNIDPGLISLENLILSTGKNYAHRIHLKDGVYADLTLIFQNGSYRGLEWTYPDYLESEKLDFFHACRTQLHKQQKLVIS